MFPVSLAAWQAGLAWKIVADWGFCDEANCWRIVRGSLPCLPWPELDIICKILPRCLTASADPPVIRTAMCYTASTMCYTASTRPPLAHVHVVHGAAIKSPQRLQSVPGDKKTWAADLSGSHHHSLQHPAYLSPRWGAAWRWELLKGCKLMIGCTTTSNSSTGTWLHCLHCLHCLLTPLAHDWVQQPPPPPPPLAPACTEEPFIICSTFYSSTRLLRQRGRKVRLRIISDQQNHIHKAALARGKIYLWVH